jgi:crotonobetainyl-CoA:carnitine CoA-transferase CaiB-like acyl-CoA transferase
MRLPAPTLGQHTRQVLRRLGYQDEAIDELKAAGVV